MCTYACRVYIHVCRYIHCTAPPPLFPKKAKAYKQIIFHFGLAEVELKSFVKFCTIDFVGNYISHRNSFEYSSK